MAEDIFDNHRVVGFDLETTGLSISQAKIIQFGIIGSDIDGAEIRINSLVNPYISIPKRSTDVHGITNRDVKDLPGFRAHVEKITHLFNDAIIIGHNIKRFDWPLLENEFLRCGKMVPKPHTIIDTLEIARKLKLTKPHNLGALCKNYGISLTNAHDAISDASATLLLLWKIMEENPMPFRKSLEELQIWNSNTTGKLEQTLGPGINDLPIVDSNGRLRRSGSDIILSFGRHKGRTLQEVNEIDRNYLIWIKNSDKQLSTEIIEEINIILNEI
ncbi:MAG TPA: 3'-5' exonuclease [Candidatus Poseidoniaceae archaeon]|nr:3'-5' exonuclease [Candidatus Poseidoniaceae archaeon]